MRAYLSSIAGFDTFPSWDALTNASRIRPTLYVRMVGASSHQIHCTTDFIVTRPSKANANPNWDNPQGPFKLGFSVDQASGTVGGRNSNGIIETITFPRDTLNGKEKPSFSVTVSGLDPLTIEMFQASRHDYQWSGHSVTVDGTDVGDRITCEVFLWFRDSDQRVNEDGFYRMAVGIMESCEINLASEGAIITPTFAASVQWCFDRAVEGRYTDAAQKTLALGPAGALGQPLPSYDETNPYYNDSGFKFVEALQSWQTFWAKPSPAKKPGKVRHPAKPHSRGRSRR